MGRHSIRTEVTPFTHACSLPSTPQDMVETYNAAYFWLEVVAQFVIGISGFVANLVVIPILCRSVGAFRLHDLRNFSGEAFFIATLQG